MRLNKENIVTIVVLLLLLPIFQIAPLSVRASTAGPDTIGLDPSNITPSASVMSFNQNVTVSYASPSALPFQGCLAIPCYPRVLALQYAIIYNASVIDVDLTHCAVAPDSFTYCGVFPDAYALLFPVQTVSALTCSPTTANICPRIDSITGTTQKRLFVSSIAALSLAGGVISPGGKHTTIFWKVTASPATGGTTIIHFQNPAPSTTTADTFYGTSSTSPIDPGTPVIAYTATDGTYGAAAPVAVIKVLYPGGASTGVPNKNVTLDGSGSYDPDNQTGAPYHGVVRWIWSFGDATPDANITYPTISHNYTTTEQFAVFTVTLKVVDADQRLTSQPVQEQVSILRANHAPIAIFTYSIANPSKYSPQTIFTNSSVFFDARASYDPDGDSLGYLWDFGDGHTGVGKNTTNVFNSAGTFTVKLTVTEPGRDVASALTNSTTQKITVLTGTFQPLGAAFGPLQIALVGVAVAAGASVAVYFVRRRRRGPRVEELPEEWKK